MRSLATRRRTRRSRDALRDVIAACKAAGFDLVVVETSGIGQGDAAIVPLADVALYVMTPSTARRRSSRRSTCSTSPTSSRSTSSTSAARRRAARRPQAVQRNHEAFDTNPEELPVYGTMASQFNDAGVTTLYQGLLPKLAAHGLQVRDASCRRVTTHQSTSTNVIVPPARSRYLADIPAMRGRTSRDRSTQSRVAREVQQLRASARMLEQGASLGTVTPAKAGAQIEQGAAATNSGPGVRRDDEEGGDASPAIDRLTSLAADRESRLGVAERKLLAQWPAMQQAYAGDEYVVKIRDKELRSAVDHPLAVRHHDPQGGVAALRGPGRER